MGPLAKAGLVFAMVALMLAGQLLEREFASRRRAAVEEKKNAPQPYAALLAPLEESALPRPRARAQGVSAAARVLPAGPGAAPAAGGETVYVVQQGDTLAKISRRFFGTEGALDAIADRNKSALPDPAKLQVGMTLHIPSRGGRPGR